MTDSGKEAGELEVDRMATETLKVFEARRARRMGTPMLPVAPRRMMFLRDRGWDIMLLMAVVVVVVDGRCFVKGAMCWCLIWVLRDDVCLIDCGRC